MIAVGPVLQFFRQDLSKTFLLQDFPELTETAAVAQEEYGKTQQEILEKQYADILAKQCSDVLAQEGKVLDEIQVACTSQEIKPLQSEYEVRGKAGRDPDRFRLYPGGRQF
ncbi:MAG: hypothetical protein ACLR23_01220 [Clostridia bacterium]